jgi:hypothetical protein
MITITNEFASYGRNFGNKLFTYAVARIIAEKLNYKLLLPENSKIQREGIVMDFPYQSIDGTIVDGDQLYVSDHSMNETGLDYVIEHGKNKKIFLDGYFLKYQYIKNFKKEVRGYFNDLVEKNDEKNDVIILLRDSNCDSTFKLPDNYYLDILSNLTFDNLYISYDHKHKHQSLFKSLEMYDPILLDMNIIDLFKFITKKNTIIGCQGTYSFWACFLSNAKTIYWPITKIGPNSPQWAVDLYVDDDERYNYIKINQNEN